MKHHTFFTLKRALALWFATMTTLSPVASAVTLVRDGQPVSAIVLADKPTRSAELAAEELREHIRLMSGAELAVHKESEPLTEGLLPIYVGESSATRMAGLTDSRFSPQEYLIRITDTALYFIGRDVPGRHGTLYAVYDFLERQCGVRWYMVTDLGRVVPGRKTLSFEPMERRYRPWTSYRTVGYGNWGAPGVPGERDRVGLPRHTKSAPAPDNASHRQRTRFGGEPYGVNHSVYRYYERFAKEHPEWWVDGVPGPHKQLRYHKDEVVEQVARDAIEYFSKPYSERKKGIPGIFWAAGDFFGVMPLDNRDYGNECDPPLQPERQKPGQYGSGAASNYIFNWVNRVAQKVAAVYPDVWISTCGYAGMFQPPEFDMEPNVAVTVCMADGWEGYGMDVLREWRRKVSRLQTWEYWYDRASFIQVRPREVARYIGELRRMGIDGMFMEVGDPNPALYHLDYHVTMQALFYDDFDVEAALAEYYRLFYGPAESPMKRFWETMQEATAAANAQTGGSPTEAYLAAATDERMTIWEQSLDEAARLATAEPFASRIQMIRTGVFDWLKEERVGKKLVADAGIPKLVIPKTTLKPTLDGKLDDDIWKHAAQTTPFVTLYNKPQDVKSVGLMAYDDEYLYIAIRGEEPYMDKQKLVQMTSNAGICTDDSIEINIDMDRATPDYIQIMLNANNVAWFWWRTKHTPQDTPDLGIRTATHRGTNEWSCELAVPFSKIIAAPPKASDVWAINLMRNRLTRDFRDGNGDSLAQWSPSFVWSYHIRDRFGLIEFGK